MQRVTKVKRFREFTQRDRDNDVVSDDPLAIVALHLDDTPSTSTVHPVDAADWSIVAHQVRGQLCHQAGNKSLVTTVRGGAPAMH